VIRLSQGLCVIPEGDYSAIGKAEQKGGGVGAVEGGRLRCCPTVAAIIRIGLVKAIHGGADYHHHFILVKLHNIRFTSASFAPAKPFMGEYRFKIVGSRKFSPFPAFTKIVRIEKYRITVKLCSEPDAIGEK
jgi:hypothetical protein